MSVLIETSMGVLVIDLYTNERPRCSQNFLKLCKLKAYNGNLFHSVQKNLVAQTGDPTGTGRGGQSFYAYRFGDQARFFDAERKPKIHHTRRGLVSMVDNGQGQHASQFFITLADSLDYLNMKHTVFGYVAEGSEFLDQINDVYCDKENRPYRNVRIHHTIILDDPFSDPPDINYPGSPSRYPVLTLKGSPRIEEDEELDDTVDLSPSQVVEAKAEKEAQTNAQLLTLIGDLPDANIKPPDNVLFVCKLNPVTTSEDLEIIFSRFGNIVSCEVVHDKRTGASLQYAFIEFEEEKDCVEAYFKMDKVVIDDRRIHVDFSQSVSKQWAQVRHNQQRYTPSQHQDHGRSVNVPRGRDREHHSKSYSDRQDYTERKGGFCRRSRSPIHDRSKDREPNHRPYTEEEGGHQKHAPLIGADLDLVVTESDSDSSLDRRNRRHHSKRKYDDKSKKSKKHKHHSRRHR